VSAFPVYDDAPAGVARTNAKRFSPQTQPTLGTPLSEWVPRLAGFYWDPPSVGRRG